MALSSIRRWKELYIPFEFRELRMEGFVGTPREGIYGKYSDR